MRDGSSRIILIIAVEIACTARTDSAALRRSSISFIDKAMVRSTSITWAARLAKPALLRRLNHCCRENSRDGDLRGATIVSIEDVGAADENCIVDIEEEFSGCVRGDVGN